MTRSSELLFFAFIFVTVSTWANLNSSLESVVKVFSKGPPDAPVFVSSGIFLRRSGIDLVVTTSHGIYHSNIVGQFFAQTGRGEKVPCRLLAASYSLDLSILQCQVGSWSVPPLDLPFSKDEDDYYRGGKIEYYGTVLAGFPAKSSQLLVEQTDTITEFQKAPAEMLVPGVKAQYISRSQRASEGMSGGMLAVSNNRDRWQFAGLISKKIPSREGRGFRIGSIPATVVAGFIQTTISDLERGRLSPLMGSSNYAIFQDVEARLEHPLNVRVEQFSYAMEEVQIGSRWVKTIRVIPNEKIDLNIVYSPYRGINDYKRVLKRNPGCQLQIIATSLGVDNGYVYTHEKYSPLSTFEYGMSHLILTESEKNWMGLRDEVLRIDCPDQVKRNENLRQLVKNYRDLESRYQKEFTTALPDTGFIQAIETKILDPKAADMFPMNFVMALNKAEVCHESGIQCRLQREAQDLIEKINLLLYNMFLKI